MMSSMRGAASGGRAPRRGKGKSNKNQYILIGVVGAVVLVVAILLIGGGPRKPGKAPAKRTSTASTEGKKASTASTAGKKAGTQSKVATVSRTAQDSRESRREERARLREEARAERKARGSRRDRSGGYSSGSRSSYSANTLRAVITDGSGTRMALVGERRLKVGDELDGRRVTEVGTDAVKVEYRQSQYTVRIGGSLY